MDNKNEEASVVLVQKHQLDQGQVQLGRALSTLEELDRRTDARSQRREEIACTIEGLRVSLESQDVAMCNLYVTMMENLLTDSDSAPPEKIPFLSQLDIVEAPESVGWKEYVASAQMYAERNGLDLTKDPFDSLMTDSQRISIEKRINEDFTLKAAHCDKYDYMVAVTCGFIGGLVDILFVGLPGSSKLGEFSDKAVDGAVEKFASMLGWQGAQEGGNPTKSAIGFLERKYKVNYDHRHGGDVDGLFRMSTKNHHIKNLAHSPDLVGLFFSILAQFTNTAHFVDSGKIISVDTESYELQGTNLVSKVFAGFTNWLGHLFSDVAGSSGAQGRGSGIPIPFFSLLQFVNVGEFGQYRQSFATVCVQVFEQGYDFRHGLAMAIPVLISELLTRIMWTFKQRVYHDAPWKECIPSANNPELRRMLLVSHGSLCIVDACDAGLKSGGDIIQFMLRTNLIAWARFGNLAYKEMTAWYRVGSLDIDAVDAHLDQEYKRMLQWSP
nr:hypothetical protein [uncultured Pseudodesulfovibrio sp.]